MILARTVLVEEKANLADGDPQPAGNPSPPNVNCAHQVFPQNWPR
jgi:hypothetical protein